MPRKKANPSVEAGGTSAKEGKKKPIISVRGVRDILPSMQPYWQRLRKIAEKVCQDYGYQRIDLPTVEFRKLFERSAGKTSDVVEKEMFNFKTQGGDEVCLRPEATASIVRAYLEHGMLSNPKPVKLFYMGPMFRYDRPQAGRYREFYQFGFEALGENDAILDAQLIQIASRILKLIGIKEYSLELNSIGCRECRPAYNKFLINYLNNHKSALCIDCKKRLKKNPLRILDCKESKCKAVAEQAPQTTEHLCETCKSHFTFLLECLDELEIPYNINPRLVRGLDYYTKTVFEFWAVGKDGAQNALLGGGRYDYLIRELGGPETPAVGFACGMDRVVDLMIEEKIKFLEPPKIKVYLAQLGDLAKKKSLKIFEELEKNGITVMESFGKGNLKTQLKQANRIRVEIVLILGQREALDETVILKDMNTGSQEVITFAKIISEIKKRLKQNE